MQPSFHTDLNELHQLELRSVAEVDRIARQLESGRPIRRQLGRLLIKAGERVAGYRVVPAACLDGPRVEAPHPVPGH